MEGNSSAVLAEINELPLQDVATDPALRKRAIELSKKLTTSLEEPVNRAIDLAFSQPFVVAAARISIDLGLFRLIKGHYGPVSTETLAKLSGGEELLIFRLLRLLAAVGFVHEVAENSWSATALTHAMASDTIAAGHRMIWDLITTSVIAAPKFLRETGHASPSEPTDGFLQYAHQTKHDVFGFLNTKPQLAGDFDTFMGNTMGTRPYWYDWFPVQEKLLTDYHSSSALLVDVGGGKGHDIQAFYTKFSNTGQLVLQDLPQVLQNIKAKDLDDSIEKMEYDFFTEQPVKAARAYFLHHILHDWSDKHCLRILGQLHAAMQPGYSKLLIHDLILPDTGASAYQCIYDMTMMTFNSSLERSRSQWVELLSEAGFDIVKFWVDDEDADGIVEAVVKE
ncbi:hypothetical protein ACKAV7_014714 [Fusarium commune]